MSVKTILVHLDTGPHCIAGVELAIRLAATHASANGCSAAPRATCSTT